MLSFSFVLFCYSFNFFKLLFLLFFFLNKKKTNQIETNILSSCFSFSVYFLFLWYSLNVRLCASSNHVRTSRCRLDSSPCSSTPPRLAHKERISTELIQELCDSPVKLRQYAKEQAIKYPKTDLSKRANAQKVSTTKKGHKRKATSKLDDDRQIKIAKRCDLFGMKEKDALNKMLMASAQGPLSGSNPSSTIGSINDDEEASSTTSNRLAARDLTYSVVDNECTSIEMNLRRLCALCKLTHPEIRPTTMPKSGGTVKVTEKNVHGEEYKVSKVIKVEYDGKPKYEVRWEGYADTTWEPVKNIWDCTAFQVFTDNFIRSRKVEMELLWNEMIQTIATESLEPICDDLAAIEQVKKFNYNDFLSHFFMMVRMQRASKNPRSKDYQQVYKFLLNDMKYLRYYIQRLDQLQNMYEFQQRINIVDQSKNLHVENVVDFEMPPMDDFTYTNDVIPRDGIVIPDDPPVGCDCAADADGQCSLKSQCCPMQFDSQFAYNSRGLIRVKQGTPIFECNKACKCSVNCPNRVVQKGRKQTLCIFKTKGRGWGVRTERAIAKGQYICEYVGEIISYEETERRGKEYDAVGRTYLFDLDFNEKDNPYTVDAAKFGNVSRFINHSCDPNLGVWAVWTNCLDLNLPKLCLFTLRPIKENEELTFDYVNSTNSQAADNDLDASESKDTFNESMFTMDSIAENDIKLSTDEKLERESSSGQATEYEVILKEEVKDEILIKQVTNEASDMKPNIENPTQLPTNDGIDDAEKVQDAPKNTKKEGFACHCGAAKCRKIIFC